MVRAGAHQCLPEGAPMLYMSPRTPLHKQSVQGFPSQIYDKQDLSDLEQSLFEWVGTQLTGS